MQLFKADLHIHTVLSPCGDLEMSPVNIVNEAVQQQIDILGITDHNSTKHGMLIKQLAEKKGIFVLCGAEVTTKEEIHCLTFFEHIDALKEFQSYLDVHLIKVKNNPDKFGYQVVVDEEEQIVELIDYLLISAIGQGISQVEEKVHSLNGLFIPAHIDRPSYSLISQLGFIPPGIRADAMEISRHTTADVMRAEHRSLRNYTLLRNSDAHLPGQIGSSFTMFKLQNRNFREIAMALKGEQGRQVVEG